MSLNFTGLRDSGVDAARKRRQKERTSVPTYLAERHWPGATLEQLLKALHEADR